MKKEDQPILDCENKSAAASATSTIATKGETQIPKSTTQVDKSIYIFCVFDK